ncbi:YidC/Oxa1 family membrane protein insertase [Candidatus Parcubacteria bacterium]|nr:YidC/Oxa1 family membrane protein insertase [Candidatus Parcubacteria bacterium]
MDLGVAVVLITVAVKLILFPLTKASIKTQIKIKEIEPALAEIKEKYKKDREMLAKETMALYSKNKINPFSSFMLILVQLPILFALYFVFLKGGLPEINLDILYSFIDAPTHINNIRFLGIIDITQKSFILALTAGLSQFFQIRLVLPKQQTEDKNKVRTMKDDLIKNMQLQMRYVMPVFIFFISYGLISAIALYWTASNLFMIGQELYVRKTLKNGK